MIPGTQSFVYVLLQTLGGRFGADQKEREHDESGWDGRKKENRLQGKSRPEESRRDQRTDSRSCVVHGTVEPISFAMVLLGSDIGNERVSGRGAHAFAQAVKEAGDEDDRPGFGEPHPGPRAAGEKVTAQDKWMSAFEAVGPRRRRKS